MRFLILGLLLVVSCGKEVKFTNHLETSNKLTSLQPVAITQAATLVRGTNPSPGKLIMNGKTYSVSPFSSYVALNFINQQAMGAQVPVHIRGEVKGTEVYIKVIE